MSFYIKQAGMENYQGMESYEPSADELINVLKNLENLAALNPALYRAIVDQINGKCQYPNLLAQKSSAKFKRYTADFLVCFTAVKMSLSFLAVIHSKAKEQNLIGESTLYKKSYCTFCIEQWLFYHIV